MWRAAGSPALCVGCRLNGAWTKGRARERASCLPSAAADRHRGPPPPPALDLRRTTRPLAVCRARSRVPSARPSPDPVPSPLRHRAAGFGRRRRQGTVPTVARCNFPAPASRTGFLAPPAPPARRRPAEAAANSGPRRFRVTRTTSGTPTRRARARQGRARTGGRCRTCRRVGGPHPHPHPARPKVSVSKIARFEGWGVLLNPSFRTFSRFKGSQNLFSV